MNTPQTDPPKKLLTFPCDYPIKVMARVVPGLRTQLDAIVHRHAGPLESHRISERPSAQQNFIGITYLIHAHSEQQIAALFEDLKQCPAVMLVL
jgi:putative lipoic acid-binding regulatory protein